MVFYSKNIIFIALVLTVAIPISTGRESWSRPERLGSDTERYVRDLCSKTNRSNECWDILKPELYRFKDLDDTTVVGVVVDLAIKKSSKIHDQLNQLHSDSKNNELKEKYISCSKNYNDVNRNLVVARKDLDTKNYVNIHVQVEDAQEELMNCKRRFGNGSFDPAHITDRNKELGLYLEIVWAATDGSGSTNDNGWAGHRDRDIWGQPRESRSDTERYLRDLCSETNRADECWNVLRPELNRFTDTNGTTIVGVVVDLAIAKSNEIHDKLNRLHSDSKDNEMKEKYISCSKNYNDMNRNLVVARRDLATTTKDYSNIPVQVKDARDELNNCKRKFENESPDPAHIGDRNNEFGLYLDIVWAAANGSKYDNGDKDIWSGPRNDTERYLSDLCSKTNRSNECWEILKPELHKLKEKDSSDNKTVVIAVVDMATTKSKEIHNKLNQLYSDSKNNELREKYISCSKNYNDVNRNLVVARRDLDSNDRMNVPVEVKDARDELNNCKRAFEKDSFDPAHITDRNKELELYLDIVWVATNGLNGNNNRT